MTHASICTGSGVTDYIANILGWENIFQVERDKACNILLNNKFPNTHKYGDAKEFDGRPYRGTVDIISSGFPCQPFSVSGKRGGKKDNRYLWPEVYRIIEEVRPRWVVLENVAGIIQLALGQVISDLEASGYFLPTDYSGNPIIPIIPAGSVGAEHRRDRIWIIANSTSSGWCQLTTPNISSKKKEGQSSPFTWLANSARTETWDTHIAKLLRMADGTSEGLHSYERRNRIKMMGNAMDARVVFQIFSAIDKVENLLIH